jgi:hypothetical protein
VVAHHDQPFGKRNHLVQCALLIGARGGQDGVQRRHHGHAQLAQQGQHVPARGAAEDAVLVLQTHHVDRVDVQKLGRTPVRVDLAFGDLEAHALRIRVRLGRVVQRHDQRLDCRSGFGRGRRQIGGERGDPALARQIRADEGNLLDGSRGMDAGHAVSVRARAMQTRKVPPLAKSPPARREVSFYARAESSRRRYLARFSRRAAETSKFRVRGLHA